MSIAKRSVKVFQVPSAVTASVHAALLQDFSVYTNNGRTRAVLDCSRVSLMTTEVMQVLLCCLEESMKTNGDVRLAGMSAHAQAALMQSGIGRLFEQFDTVESAVASFTRISSLAAVGFNVRQQRRASDQAAA